MNWKTSICFHFWSFISLFIYFTLILTHSPILTELSVVLLVSMTGSMRWYLKPIQVTDIVQLLQDSIFIHAVAKMFALHLSAQCITWMLNNNIQEYWPGSRVRSIATALQNDIQSTTRWTTTAHVTDETVKSDSVRMAWGPNIHKWRNINGGRDVNDTKYFNLFLICLFLSLQWHVGGALSTGAVLSISAFHSWQLFAEYFSLAISPIFRIFWN